jgi:hypothetical protein
MTITIVLPEAGPIVVKDVGDVTTLSTAEKLTGNVRPDVGNNERLTGKTAPARREVAQMLLTDATLRPI